uniref:RING-type domain-containing protein n=1 Tax=Chlamydomonas leiostraca TaxID=1034604 RepID=A0A7S0RTN9_9CHLO|mmetsp:Transcript_31362/g.80024  ORF Transcript_31362/g.80024 Transcript_31362/m.80024 type:complete len:313 (+) Transcript_31362:355-1293(+)
MAGVPVFKPDGSMDPAMRAYIQRQALEPYLDGKDYLVRFLTSERGRALNGRLCKVTGITGGRLEVRMKDNGEVARLKSCNLHPADRPHGPVPGPALGAAEVVARLRTALAHTRAEEYRESQRPDICARMALVEAALAQPGPDDAVRVPAPSPCMDPLIPPDRWNGLVTLMNDQRPCCCGDGTVDFARFATGLLGAGGVECTVCTEEMARGCPALGFPCGHVFHRQCAVQWLRGHNTCPICRMQLGMPGGEYVHMWDYERRLRLRLQEWFISGMCERCQAAFHERDPLVAVDDGRGQGPSLVPRSALGENPLG